MPDRIDARDPATAVAIRADRNSRSWYRVYRAMMWPFIRGRLRIRTTGMHHVPKCGPFILVSNHRSNQDPMVLSCVLPHHLRWVVAGYMRQVPLSGYVMTRMGVVYVDPGRRGMRSLLREGAGILERGGTVAIFPEGHDFIFGGDPAAPMADFHAGFAALAVRTGAPVLPVVIRPVREELCDVPIPAAARSSLPHEFERGSVAVPRYRSVQVRFGAPLDPGEGRGDLHALVSATRERMHALAGE